MNTVKGPDSKEARIEQMVVRHQLPLLRLCYAYLHDEELAKDAVQETFIKAYQNLEDFRESSSEKTWLTRIAINTCKDLRRSGWFRHMDRSVTPDMIPEPVAPVEPEEESLTMEIMKFEHHRLPGLRLGTCRTELREDGVPNEEADSCSTVPADPPLSYQSLTGLIWSKQAY